MDVKCEQKEGYRFFYVLPWSSHSILVEDTRYTSNPQVNLEEFKNEIRAYCKQSNWTVRNENRIEVGSLPIPLAPFTPPKYTATVPIGAKGGYFHWTTGYSFSFAVRVAEVISQELQRNSEAKKADFEKSLEPIQSEVKRQSQYFSLLNRMLFLAAEPSQRWKIFQRFYHFNDDLIFRFYKGNLKITDQARILMGRPPVPIHSAIKSIFNQKGCSDNHGQKSNETTW
jgi:lycopene beta-cyclase